MEAKTELAQTVPTGQLCMVSVWTIQVYVDLGHRGVCLGRFTQNSGSDLCILSLLAFRSWLAL